MMCTCMKMMCTCMQMMIPRISYFPLVFDKLEKLYSRLANVEASDKEIWLSAEDTPLKW